MEGFADRKLSKGKYNSLVKPLVQQTLNFHHTLCEADFVSSVF